MDPEIISNDFARAYPTVDVCVEHGATEIGQSEWDGFFSSVMDKGGLV